MTTRPDADAPADRSLGASVRSTDDASLRRIAERYGTPVYVYDLDAVSARLAHLRAALPGAVIHYAVKANPCHAVLRHLADRGVCAEVLTAGELARALRAGFPASRVLLSGPGQSASLIERAKQGGVALASLDSRSQHALWESLGFGDTRFLVRVNPSLDPGTHAHLATGTRTSKFGMPTETAMAVAESLSLTGCFAGFHIHVGSQIRDVGVYVAVLETLAELHRSFPQATTANMGGGFGVPDFAPEDLRSQVQSFMDALDVQLIIEPGRYLVAEAGVLLSSVLHVKESGHVIVDAGMADFLRPALYDAHHPVRSLEPTRGRPMVVMDVDGPLCENADRLGRAVAMEAPEPGDLIVVEQAGAYGFAMASNYVSSLRPAEVVVEAGAHRLARRRETIDDAMKLELIGDSARV